MKKIISLALVVLLTLTLLPVTGGIANAASGYTNNSGVAASGGTPHSVKWTLYLDGTLYLCPDYPSLTRYLEEGDDVWAGEIAVPGGSVGHMVYVNGKEQVKAPVVEEGIGNICASMFKSYPYLKTVTLYGAPEIEEEAFSTCSALESVTVYDAQVTIGDYAFSHCPALKTFAATGIVEGIGKGAFSKKAATGFSDTSLTTFHALRIVDIGEKAFENCTSLVSVSPFHGSVGESAFRGCTKLMSENASHIILVSGHSGTPSSNAFPTDAVIYFTGTEAEFESSYTNNSGATLMYHTLGANVYWVLYGDHLDIEGSGSTIDLLEISEQPWVNNLGTGLQDDQRDAITNVRVMNDIVCGTHVLEGLENKVQPRYRLNVNNGTSDGEYFHSGSYYSDECVTITAMCSGDGTARTA